MFFRLIACICSTSELFSDMDLTAAIKNSIIKGSDVQYITERPYSETERVVLIKKEITAHLLCVETTRKTRMANRELEFLLNGRDITQASKELVKPASLRRP